MTASERNREASGSALPQTPRETREVKITRHEYLCLRTLSVSLAERRFHDVDDQERNAIQNIIDRYSEA